MKISKASLLTMGGIFSIASLGLMFFSVSAIGGTPEEGSYIQLHFDPNNAVQHFQGVKIIATEDNDDSYAIINKNGGLVGIETDYNFLMSGGDTDSNIINRSVRRSSILGGKNNKINGGANETILGGEGNIIERGDSNSILGGSGNNVLQSGNNSSILGGESNKVNGSSSSVIGGEGNEVKKSYAIAVGNNSEANGYNSVVMGSGAKVSGKNSFLWTDGHSLKTLSKSNVFVVDGQSGMVVNFTKAHSFAQLTIGGSLIIYNGDTAPQCGNNTKGVVKVVNNGDKKCLCSCDGSGRNALHDGVMCPFKCSNTPPENAVCGSARRVCGESEELHTYSGTCNTGTVVQGTGAFFVSTEIDGSTITNYINWSCQSDIGVVTGCRVELTGDGCANIHQNGQCTGDPDKFGEYAEKYTGSDNAVPQNQEWRLYDLRYENNISEKKCAYVCKYGSRIVDGKCEPCPEWAPYSGTTHGCLTDLDCKGEGELYVDNINKKYECIPYNGGKCTYKGTSKSSYSLGTIKSGNYKPLTGSMELKCIDGDKFTGSFVPKTCTYECKKDYYCKTTDSSTPPVCTKPSCNWDWALEGGDIDYYYTGGKAGNYQFGAVYTPEEIANYFEKGVIYNDGRTKLGSSLTDADVKYIQEKVGSTNTGVIVNYLRNLNIEQFKSIFNDNFQKCVFWCPGDYRSLTGKDGDVHESHFYRCLSPDTNLEELLKPKDSCESVTFFKYSGKFKSVNNPNSPSQSWEYMPRNSNSTTGCKWSCPESEGYVKLDGYAPRYDTYLYDKGIPRTTLFTSKGTYKTCYTGCKNNEYLSNVNGVLSCKTCPDGKALDLKQTSVILGKTYEAYRGCECNVEFSVWSGKTQSCVCENDKKRNSNETACVCKGQTTLNELNGQCECLGKSIKDSQNNCSCSSLGVGRIFSGGAKDCVCNAVSGFHYNETLKTCTFTASCPDEKTTLVECLGTCALVETGYMYDENCEYVPKRGALWINISNTDTQGSTKVYHNGDEISYKVTITNTGNLSLENIKSTVYYLSGGTKIRIKTGDYLQLGTGSADSYTGKYKLKTGNFTGLQIGQTGTFDLRLYVSGAVVDNYVHNLEIIPANSISFSVTIQK